MGSSTSSSVQQISPNMTGIDTETREKLHQIYLLNREIVELGVENTSLRHGRKVVEVEKALAEVWKSIDSLALSVRRGVLQASGVSDDVNQSSAEKKLQANSGVELSNSISFNAIERKKLQDERDELQKQFNRFVDDLSIAEQKSFTLYTGPTGRDLAAWGASFETIPVLSAVTTDQSKLAEKNQHLEAQLLDLQTKLEVANAKSLEKSDPLASNAPAPLQPNGHTGRSDVVFSYAKVHLIGFLENSRSSRRYGGFITIPGLKKPDIEAIHERNDASHSIDWMLVQTLVFSGEISLAIYGRDIKRLFEADIRIVFKSVQLKKMFNFRATMIGACKSWTKYTNSATIDAEFKKLYAECIKIWHKKRSSKNSICA